MPPNPRAVAAFLPSSGCRTLGQAEALQPPRPPKVCGPIRPNILSCFAPSQGRPPGRPPSCRHCNKQCRPYLGSSDMSKGPVLLNSVGMAYCRRCYNCEYITRSPLDLRGLAMTHALNELRLSTAMPGAFMVCQGPGRLSARLSARLSKHSRLPKATRGLILKPKKTFVSSGKLTCACGLACNDLSSFWDRPASSVEPLSGGWLQVDSCMLHAESCTSYVDAAAVLAVRNSLLAKNCRIFHEISSITQQHLRLQLTTTLRNNLHNRSTT